MNLLYNSEKKIYNSEDLFTGREKEISEILTCNEPKHSAPERIPTEFFSEPFPYSCHQLAPFSVPLLLMEQQQQLPCDSKQQEMEVGGGRDFNLREWGLRARMISRENTISRRFSASNISRFREDNKSFRSNFTISSTASSPGYPLGGSLPLRLSHSFHGFM